MIKLDIALRISVVDKCNFNCLYCPSDTSMENYCPSKIKNKPKTTEEFSKILNLILEKYQFKKIVITGGEPLLAPDLPIILKELKKYNTKIELDTNGSLFNLKLWNNIKNYIDEVKISLDSLNQHIFSKMTNNNSSKTLETISDFIDEAISCGMPVTLNCVYTKVNKNDIDDIIKYAKNKNINLSILDLYFSKETEEFWKKNYINIYTLENKLNNQGHFESDLDSYGCNFKYFYYNNKKNYVRIKSSMLSTMRDDRCSNCNTYCQEGIFSLRISRQGWVTVCQSNEHNGILMPEEVSKLEMLVQRIQNATKDKDSFKKLIINNHIKIPENNKIVFPCFGFIWNSLDESQMREVVSFLNRKAIIKSCKIIDFGDRYKDFLKDIYAESIEAKDIPAFKIRKLVDKYKSNQIMILELEVPVCSLVYLNKSKGIVYEEISKLKNAIRNKYMPLVKDYEFDIIFHLTDDLYEYEYVKKILNKYL